MSPRRGWNNVSARKLGAHPFMYRIGLYIDSTNNVLTENASQSFKRDRVSRKHVLLDVINNNSDALFTRRLVFYENIYILLCTHYT